MLTTSPATHGPNPRANKARIVMGNHTASHADLNRMPAERCIEDIIGGERISDQLGIRRDHCFRFPFNHTGDTPAKKTAVPTASA
jgi:hypothetical protein